VWGESATIRRIVFILIGEGSELGLFVHDEWIRPGQTGAWVSMCRGKPVLMILDFPDSGFFADEVIASNRLDSTNQPVFFLSSGKCVSRKTAIVLSDDTNTIGPAPGSEDVHYAVYSTMFHRPLLRIVASDGETRTLDELPGLLNESSGGGRFFNSVLIRAHPGAAIPSLRDFFAEPLAANSPIFGGRDGIGAVLPLGGFVDDLGDCLSERSGGDQGHVGRRFVRIAVSGGMVRVVDRGILAGDCEVVCHMKYGPSLKPRLDTELTVDILVDQLLREAVGVIIGVNDQNPPAWEPSEEHERMFRRLVKFVNRENQVEDESVLYPVRPYLSVVRWRKWCDCITEIRMSDWLLPPSRIVSGIPRSKPYR
jgi:hypothetical protein